MKQHATLSKAVLAGTAVFLSTGSGVLAGEPIPYVAPPPPPDCSGCIDPGFFVEGSLLYMNSYAADAGGYEGDWDFGYRGAVGFETASGLFAQLTGFYYDGDFDIDDDQGFGADGDIEAYTIDLLIGDTVHCGELCVAISGGVRYGSVELDSSFDGGTTEPIDESYEFDGWGPMIEIAAERSLSDNFALYMELRQSLLYGESDFSDEIGSVSSDTLASITEIAAGLQFSFGLGPVSNAFLRLGVEGQYWAVDGSDVGLLGGVVSIGGTF